MGGTGTGWLAEGGVWVKMREAEGADSPLWPFDCNSTDNDSSWKRLITRILRNRRRLRCKHKRNLDVQLSQFQQFTKILRMFTGSENFPLCQHTVAKPGFYDQTHNIMNRRD